MDGLRRSAGRVRTALFSRPGAGGPRRLLFVSATPSGGPIEDAERVAGEATDAERRAFHAQWHDRVQRILDAEPGEDSPFTLRYPED